MPVAIDRIDLRTPPRLEGVILAGAQPALPARIGVSTRGPMMAQPLQPGAGSRSAWALQSATTTPQSTTPQSTTPQQGGIRDWIPDALEPYVMPAIDGANTAVENARRTLRDTTARWSSWLGAQVDWLRDLGRQALGYAANITHVYQMRLPRPNVACFRACMQMGENARLNFSGPSGPDAVSARTPDANRRFLADLSRGVPVMIAAYYERTTAANAEPNADGSNHAIVAQSIESYEPLVIRVLDPRTNQQHATQRLQYDPQSQQFTPLPNAQGETPTWPYRAVTFRFATNVPRLA